MAIWPLGRMPREPSPILSRSRQQHPPREILAGSFANPTEDLQHGNSAIESVEHSGRREFLSVRMTISQR